LIKKEVLEIKRVSKAEQVEDTGKVKKSPDKPNIAMVITGGTIAARLDTKTGAVSWLDNPKTLFKFYPELFEKVNVSKS